MRSRWLRRRTVDHMGIGREMSETSTKPVREPKAGPKTVKDQAERNTVRMAYEWIESQILSGQFKAGQTLPQGMLAQHCNTSRGPIREALRMLQQQGLIEAETNQRGRVASFTAHDLELTIASAIINTGAAISRHKGTWTPAEVKRFEKLIDEVETLSRAQGATVEARRDLIAKRQQAYRSIVMDLCVRGGAPTQQMLAGHFDRITIFRQMSSIKLGGEPEFPLAADMNDLRKAIRAGDAKAAALAIVERMAELGRRGLDDMGEYHMGGEITEAVSFVRNALGVDRAGDGLKQVRTSTSQKVWVELKGKETLIWNFSDE